MITEQDGQEAMEKAASGPDRILLEVNMPVMDGIEVCRQIRDKISCPILFLTARARNRTGSTGFFPEIEEELIELYGFDKTVVLMDVEWMFEGFSCHFAHTEEHNAYLAQKMAEQPFS